MGGVDKYGQLLSYYGFNHRTVKLYKRATFHSIDLTITNAYILYEMSTQTERSMSHVQFWINLTRASIDLTLSASFPWLPPDACLHEHHFLDKIPPCSSKKPSQHECIVCSYKKQNGRKTTTYHCKQCKVALCVVYIFVLIKDVNSSCKHPPPSHPLRCVVIVVIIMSWAMRNKLG